MSVRRILIACSLAGAVVLSFTASSAQVPDTRMETASGQAAILLGRNLRAGRSVAELRQHHLRVFDGSDLDGGGIGPSDRSLRDAQAAAALRVRELSRLLAHDLDGDGAVTTAELRRSLLPKTGRPLQSAAGHIPPTSEQIATTLDGLVARMKLSESDIDGNGSVTIEEVLAAADRRTRPQGRPHERMDPAFDLDGDGIITRDEFSAALDAAIAMIDTDGGDRVSEAEAGMFRQRLADIVSRQRILRQRAAQREELRKRAEACAIPIVPTSGQIVYLALFKPLVLSSVTFGRAESWTGVTDIVIEPSEAPIYLLVASHHPMILRFSGAIERLSHAVNVGNATVGFAGIDRARASWFERGGCAIGRRPGGMLAIRSRKDGLKAEDRAFLETLTGRPIDRVIGEIAAYRIALPSGEVIIPERIPGQLERREGLAGPVWKRAREGQHEGLVVIDPQDVLAPRKLKPYQVPETGLPQP